MKKVLKCALGALVGVAAFSIAPAAHAACSSGLACEQCDVSGYSPTNQAPPLGPSTGACSDTDIQDFVTACVDTSATQATCSAWQTSAPAACSACIVTTNTAASWGALVCASTGCQFNTGGCVDLVLGQVSQEASSGGNGSCGDLINASYGCQDYACGTCSSTDFTTCDQSAIANECASYSAPVTSTTGPCAVLNGDAGPPQAATCFPQTVADDNAFIAYFCGGGTTPPPDGGTTTDGGVKKDGGGSDGGGSTDGGGGDGGFSGGKGGGCHCAVAHAPSHGAGATAGVGVLALVLRRRRRAPRR
jgi:uncharacterized protein (TIGR03382 family)